MKRIALALAFCGAFTAQATEDTNEVATASTPLLIVSNVEEVKAKVRQVVMASENNQLIDPSRQIASYAEAEALAAATEEVEVISVAAKEALDTSMKYLYDNTNKVAKASQTFAMDFAPLTDRANLTAYVVKEETDGIVDYQWVWYSQELALPPNRSVVYEYDGGSATNAVTWMDENPTVQGWNPQGVTVDGWSGCHKCKVNRPTFAQNIPVITRPNDVFGNANGFGFGSMLVTIDGIATYTGYVTNTVNSVVAYFDNGVLKELVPLEETE